MLSPANGCTQRPRSQEGATMRKHGRERPTASDTYWREKVRAARIDGGDLILFLGFFLVMVIEMVF
jgi:hypothetical protein